MPSRYSALALAAAALLALAAPGAWGFAGSVRPGASTRVSSARRCGSVRCVASEPEAPAKKKFRVGPRQYPLSAIVGMDNVKTALLLASVNPYIGGVVIAGSRGTAKSVMARAAHSLMPNIEVIKGSPYNIDPSDKSGAIDSVMMLEMEATGKTLADYETEIITVPFCQGFELLREKGEKGPHACQTANSLSTYSSYDVPLDVLEDRLLGSVDLEKSLSTYSLLLALTNELLEKSLSTERLLHLVTACYCWLALGCKLLALAAMPAFAGSSLLAEVLTFSEGSQKPNAKKLAAKTPSKSEGANHFRASSLCILLKNHFCVCVCGQTIFEPGLLARAHRGVLYIDDINLLDESVSNLLLSVISNGEVIVEREGLSVRYPCRPILVATYNPEGGDLRDHLLDRIGICLSADAEPLTLEQRIEATAMAIRFGSKPDDVEEEARQAWRREGGGEALYEKYLTCYNPEAEEAMAESLVFARAMVKDVTISKAQIAYLCEEAKRAGVQGHRAEMFATQVARSAAAIEGRDQVDAEDLKLADEEEQDDAAPPVPEEFMLDADGTALDPSVMQFAMRAKTGRSGKGNLIFSEDRGRYIKPMLPKGKVKRLAVDATLRAAAPFQRGRRIRAEEKGKVSTSHFIRISVIPQGKGRIKPVYIESGDVRAKKMARKAVCARPE
ncbi:P-loop containing nucleoside triphosphate hydrolase protein [Pavlovales sp. CCMP2436]|nr:P-loop containing nucleoside triphosphate hydrolase protein [Pavlovales sp. CCMP2436]